MILYVLDTDHVSLAQREHPVVTKDAYEDPVHSDGLVRDRERDRQPPIPGASRYVRMLPGELARSLAESP